MLGSKSEDGVGRGRGRPIRPGSNETEGERGRRGHNSGEEPEQSLGRRKTQSPNRARMGGAGTSGGGRMETAVVVGIDVSKRSLEVGLSRGGGFSVANDADGIGELLARLGPSGAALVVLEASGGYERPSYLTLWEAGVPTALINPRDAYHFAQANRQLAKTDQLDARGLCEFGLRMQPEPLPPPQPANEELKALAVRRRQVVKRLAAERTRVRQGPRSVRSSVKRIVRVLERELGAVDHQIEQRLRDNPRLAQRCAQLEQVPGLGPVTCAILVSRLPELGLLGPKQVAALVGVAPYDHQSGWGRGGSSTFGGRRGWRRPSV